MLVRVTDNPTDKWFKKTLEFSGMSEDGTYKAVGPHFNNNPDNFEMETLIKHGDTTLEVERTFNGIRQFLENTEIEGIVFHRKTNNGTGELCKIKRSDFGFNWTKKVR